MLKISLSFADYSLNIPRPAGADCRRSFASEAWQWKQANGALRDMVCRGLLLMLHRAGEIELPPIRYRPPNPLVRRERPQPMLIDMAPLSGALRDIRPFLIEQVRKTADEPLFNSLMEQHHYLGYEQPVGEHLKYLVWAQGRPIACMAPEHREDQSRAGTEAPPATVDMQEREKPAPAGHGRNGADAFTGADRIAIAHATLLPGDSCPGCRKEECIARENRLR